MSAQSVEVITLAFNDPDRSAFGSRNTRFDRLDGDISYQFLTSFDIRTLSVHGANSGSSLSGLLYVPTLRSNNECVEVSESYVPGNVTRRADLPDTDFKLIALAPWITPSCTLSYLEAAREDRNVQAFLFYLPTNETGTPPLANSNVWGLGDGGEWKNRNDFPVYALPGKAGQDLMDQSQYWSGSVDEVGLEGDLPRGFNQDAYVRLAADIDTGSSTSLPSLWVFLLIVLGILLGFIGLTSLIMHYLQRRRRNDLRNRVANGQVDLEALGIKRLTVPQDQLDRMPLYTYGSRAPGQYDSSATAAHNANIHLASSEKAKSHHTSQNVDRPGSPSSSAHASPAIQNNPTGYTPDLYSQPTCAICLDDFVPSSTTPTPTKGTTVRELPCHHIFHPECVDAFLRDNSSLCPLCKKTALPQGYCPRNITNAMVRRERLMRRMRDRGLTDPEGELPILPPGEERAPGFRAVSERVRRGYRRWNVGGGNSGSAASDGRRFASAPVRSQPQSQHMTELEPWGRDNALPARPGASAARTASERRTLERPQAEGEGPAIVQPANTAGRREWARRRALNMLGRQRAEVQDPDEQEARTRSRWRKVAGGVFPSLGR